MASDMGGFVSARRATYRTAQGFPIAPDSIATQDRRGFPESTQDPFFDKVALLLHGDGAKDSTTISDSSRSPKTITVVSPARNTPVKYLFGGSSLNFDGATARLSVASSTDFDIGTGDFCLECFINPDIVGSSIKTLFSRQENGATAFAFQFRINTSSKIEVVLRPTGSGTATVLASTTSIPTGTWTYAATGRERGTVFIKVGDNVEGTTAATFSLSPVASKAIGVGVLDDGSGIFSAYYQGFMEELRFTVGSARGLLTGPAPIRAFSDF